MWARAEVAQLNALHQSWCSDSSTHSARKAVGNDRERGECSYFSSIKHQSCINQASIMMLILFKLTSKRIQILNSSKCTKIIDTSWSIMRYTVSLPLCTTQTFRHAQSNHNNMHTSFHILKSIGSIKWINQNYNYSMARQTTIRARGNDGATENLKKCKERKYWNFRFNQSIIDQFKLR